MVASLDCSTDQHQAPANTSSDTTCNPENENIHIIRDKSIELPPDFDEDRSLYRPHGKWSWTNGLEILSTDPGKKLGYGLEGTANLKLGRINGKEIVYVSKLFSVWDRWRLLFSYLYLNASSKYLRTLQGVCVPWIIGVFHCVGGRIGVAQDLPHHTGWREADMYLEDHQKQAIVDAYQKLHDRGILHGDAEYRHWLIGDDGNITIIDFGFTRVLEADDGAQKANVETCSLRAIHEEMRKVKVMLNYKDSREKEFKLAKIRHEREEQHRARRRASRGVNKRICLVDIPPPLGILEEEKAAGMHALCLSDLNDWIRGEKWTAHRYEVIRSGERAELRKTPIPRKTSGESVTKDVLPLPEPSKSVTTDPLPLTEPPQSATTEPLPLAKPSRSVTIDPLPLTESPQPVTTDPLLLTEPPQSVKTDPLPLPEPPQSVMTDPSPLPELPRSVGTDGLHLAEIPQSVTTDVLPLPDSSQPVTTDVSPLAEPSQSTRTNMLPLPVPSPIPTSRPEPATPFGIPDSLPVARKDAATPQNTASTDGRDHRSGAPQETSNADTSPKRKREPHESGENSDSSSDSDFWVSVADLEKARRREKEIFARKRQRLAATARVTSYSGRAAGLPTRWIGHPPNEPSDADRSETLRSWALFNDARNQLQKVQCQLNSLMAQTERYRHDLLRTLLRASAPQRQSLLATINQPDSLSILDLFPNRTNHPEPVDILQTRRAQLVRSDPRSRRRQIPEKAEFPRVAEIKFTAHTGYTPRVPSKLGTTAKNAVRQVAATSLPKKSENISAPSSTNDIPPVIPSPLTRHNLQRQEGQGPSAPLTAKILPCPDMKETSLSSESPPTSASMKTREAVSSETHALERTEASPDIRHPSSTIEATCIVETIESHDGDATVLESGANIGTLMVSNVKRKRDEEDENVEGETKKVRLGGEEGRE